MKTAAARGPTADRMSAPSRFTTIFMAKLERGSTGKEKRRVSSFGISELFYPKCSKVSHIINPRGSQGAEFDALGQAGRASNPQKKEHRNKAERGRGAKRFSRRSEKQLGMLNRRNTQKLHMDQREI
ncbi:hypothetical protein SRHO_G00327100 [Serrasalmus rhombeus]